MKRSRGKSATVEWNNLAGAVLAPREGRRLGEIRIPQYQGGVKRREGREERDLIERMVERAGCHK